MNIYFKRIVLLISMVLVVAVSISACKPSYEEPAADPVMTTASADTPYDFDFVQLNNDVIDSLALKRTIFPFIKSIDIDGNNDTKNIEVTIDINQNVSDDAVQILLSEVTKDIANNAYIQDFRLKKADDEQFGSVFDIYSYAYRVTCGDQTLYDENILAGNEIPLDPSMDGNTVKEALEQLASADSSSEEETTADSSK